MYPGHETNHERPYEELISCLNLGVSNRVETFQTCDPAALFHSGVATHLIRDY
jgi:hypothetical protein